MYERLVIVISVFRHLSLHICNYGCGCMTVNISLLVKKGTKYCFLILMFCLLMACFHFLIPFFPSSPL